MFIALSEDWNVPTHDARQKHFNASTNFKKVGVSREDSKTGIIL